MNELTLIVTYRDRPKHLSLFAKQWNSYFSIFCNLVFIEDGASSTAHSLFSGENITYLFNPNNGVFNKAKLINLALEHTDTHLFCVFDIDLISSGDSLKKHLELAKKIKPNVIAGYRLNTSYNNFAKNNLKTLSLSSEMKRSAILKYLTSHERFGVNPIYETFNAKAINCFDETFNGWGCEDQDFLERYLEFNKSSLLQSYDLLYIHIKHKHNSKWKNNDLTESNRKYYYSKRIK
jgi:predicted glycosyltransferase involved in capsule biosynthesis